MRVVSSIDDLGFFEKRLPRVTLRIAADAVEASSRDGSVRVPSVVTVIRKSDRNVIAGVASDQVRDPTATTLNVFSSDVGDGEREQLIEEFLRRALKQLPPTRGFLLPIVVVENIQELARILGGRQREIVGRAVERWGATAVVMA
jgi:hypothetical protein